MRELFDRFYFWRCRSCGKVKHHAEEAPAKVRGMHDPIHTCGRCARKEEETEEIALAIMAFELPG